MDSRSDGARRATHIFPSSSPIPHETIGNVNHGPSGAATTIDAGISSVVAPNSTPCLTLSIPPFRASVPIGIPLPQSKKKSSQIFDGSKLVHGRIENSHHALDAQNPYSRK